MYAMLWRALPGGTPARILQCLVLLGLVVTVLFLWVFPAVAERLPYEQVTVSPATGAAVGEAADRGSGAGLVMDTREGALRSTPAAVAPPVEGKPPV